MRQCSLHMVDLCLNYCIQYETVFNMVDLCLNYCIQYETVFTAHGRFSTVYNMRVFTAHGRFVFKLLYTI